MIHYKEGYKYQLVEGEHWFRIGDIREASYPPSPGGDASLDYWDASPFLRLYTNGTVVQRIGYSWDGASGPTIDDSTNMVPALEHDGSYQLIRAGILPEDPWRKYFDKRFRKGMIYRNMNWFRAWYWFWSVRLFGHDAATIKRTVLTAR